MAEYALDLEQSQMIDAQMRRIRSLARRNQLRSAYYEGEARLRRMSVTVPPQMQDLAIVVGWPKKVVTVRAARLHPEGYRLPRQSGLLDQVEDALDAIDFEIIDSAARETAIQYGCAFVFSSLDESGELIMSVCTPEHATATIDRRTRQVTSAIEVIDYLNVVLFTPEVNARLTKRDGRWHVLEESEATGRTTCTVYVHDESLRRNFGQSAITRPIMGLTDVAVRTLLRQEVSAEFYSSPQRYMLGADQSMFEDERGNLRPAWETLLGSMLVAPPFVDDETLEQKVPTVGQFPQQSMQPHSDQMKTVAMMMSSESSIPPSRLGLVSANPASASAMIADEADLITITEQQQPGFARARKSVAIDVAYLLRSPDDPLPDREFAQLATRWRNAATPNAQSQAQAVQMLVTSGVLPTNDRVTWEMMGFDDSTIQRLEQREMRMGSVSLMQNLRQVAAQARQDPLVAQSAAAGGRALDDAEPDSGEAGDA